MEARFPTDRIIAGSLCYIIDQTLDEPSVLLLRRSRPPQLGLWSAPGGKIEPGESPEECAVREIHEETGLIIQRPDLRAIITVYDQKYPIHWLLFIYRVYTFTGTIQPCNEGELCWIPVDDLRDYARPYADRQSWAHVVGDDPGVWRGKYVYDSPETLVEEIRY